MLSNLPALSDIPKKKKKTAALRFLKDHGLQYPALLSGPLTLNFCQPMSRSIGHLSMTPSMSSSQTSGTHFEKFASKLLSYIRGVKKNKFDYYFRKKKQ